MKRIKKIMLLSCLLVWGNSFANTNSTQLTYQYSTPYSGGSALTIYNRGNTSVKISVLNFSMNAEIAGSAWGSLWGWQSTITHSPNPDGVSTNYTITENPEVEIAPNQSAVLSFSTNSQSISGPFSPYNVVMNPTEVSVKLQGAQTAIPVNIDKMCEGTACNDPGNGKRILGYLPDWAYWRNPKFTADKMPIDKINTIAYAFSIFDKNGNISLYDHDADSVNLPIISQMRLRYPYLNASLSFGGWSWASTPPGWQCKTGASPDGPAACFSEMAADSQATQAFISNAVKAMKEVNFNGIDIDWEYPRPEDAANYVKLLQGLRSALDEQGRKDNKHYYLTIATGAGIDKINDINKTQWQAIAAAVDYIDVMTYDFHGAWDKGQVGSDFMAAMQLDTQRDPTANNPVLGKYSVVDSLNLYRSNGINPEKLVVGVPVYGRMVNIASAGETKGLYQPITDTPQGEWDNQQSGFTGMVDYNCVVDKSTCGNNYSLPDLTLVDPTIDPLGQAALTPWGYAAHYFVTYDDEKSAAYKANWVKQNNYAGVMLWDLTGDFPDNDKRSIVNAIHAVFNQKNLK
jgi:GH18 family chitinase